MFACGRFINSVKPAILTKFQRPPTRRSLSYLSSSLNLKCLRISFFSFAARPYNRALIAYLYCECPIHCYLGSIGGIEVDMVFIFDGRDVSNKLQMVRIEKKFLYPSLVGIVSSSLIFLMACFSRYFADEILLRSPRRVRWSALRGAIRMKNAKKLRISSCMLGGPLSGRVRSEPDSKFYPASHRKHSRPVAREGDRTRTENRSENPQPRKNYYQKKHLLVNR